jgi:hypothetical protein
MFFKSQRSHLLLLGECDAFTDATSEVSPNKFVASIRDALVRAARILAA